MKYNKEVEDIRIDAPKVGEIAIGFGFPTGMTGSDKLVFTSGNIFSESEARSLKLDPSIEQKYL